MITFKNSESCVFSGTFDYLLPSDGLFSGQISLRVVKDFATGVVNIESTTYIAFRGRVAAKSIKAATTISADEVIAGDTVAWLEVIPTKICTGSTIRARCFGRWRAATSFGHQTGPTLDMRSINSRSGRMSDGNDGCLVEG